MRLLLKTYLRFVDPRLAVVVAVLLVSVIGVNRFWAVSASRDLVAKEAEIRANVAEVDALRVRLDELRSGDVADVSGLVARVSRLEALVPPTLDELSTVQLLVVVADSSGVTLDEIKLSEETPAADGVVKGYRFAFVVRGSFDATADFFDLLTSSRQFVATFDELELVSAGTGDLPSVFGGDVIAKGQITVWGLAVPPVAPSVSIPAPVRTVPAEPSEQSEPADTTATTVPSDTPAEDPGVPATTLPPDAATTTTPPAAPTTP